MPFGSPEGVRSKVKLYCEHVGKGSGLWIAPTHLVEPEIPWENIIAFSETADEYARGSNIADIIKMDGITKNEKEKEDIIK